MFGKPIRSKCLAAWLCVALAAPLACTYGGNWLGLLLTAILISILTALTSKLSKPLSEHGKFYAVSEWLVLVLFLGSIAPRCSDCWSGDKAHLLIPFSLLFLAAFSSQSGAERSARVCTVMVWGVGFFLAAVILAGADTIELKRLAPEIQLPTMQIMPFLLVPALVGFLPKQKVSNFPFFAIPLYAAFITAWISASLSAAVCMEEKNPFLEYCKGITLVGSVQRFEAVIACVLTVSWFSLFALVLAAAGNILGGRKGVWAAAIAAAGMILLQFRVPSAYLTGICLVMWCLVPVIKKMKKVENKA